jgi:hypothetical protein
MHVRYFTNASIVCRGRDQLNRNDLFPFLENDDGDDDDGDDESSVSSLSFLYFFQKIKRTPACGPLLKLLAVLARSAVTN